MPNSAVLDDLSTRVKGLANRGQSLLKVPPVIFGSPRQLAVEPTLSWWHVPVFIQPAALHRKRLENCVATIAPTDGSSPPLRMRWRLGLAIETSTTATLEESLLFLIPVAARKETGDRAGVITNEGFFADKKAKWRMSPGESEWSLMVHNEVGKWESPHAYRLNVPAPSRGNGHFVLEVRYNGLG